MTETTQPNIVEMPQADTAPTPILSREERAKRDKEEAEKIVAEHYKEGFFTFPTAKKVVEIRDLPEASYQRFFFNKAPIDPPVAPKKKMRGKRGKDTLVSDYDNENYLSAVDVYNNHSNAVRQFQMGEMLRYIIDKGVILNLSEEEEDKLYERFAEDNEEVSNVEIKYRFMTEEGKTNAESKALLIAICGYDPMGGREDDEEDEEE